MPDKIRWGVLGCGRIARKFAHDLQLVDDAILVAAGARSIKSANAFAKDIPVTYTHGSYEELVQNQNVDVIYIATPHSEHYNNAMLCLEHNKAVLCEKAFAVNYTQAKAMIEKAREKKVFLMEALWTKFLPNYQKLQSLLKENILGEIKSVLINFGFAPQAPAPQRLLDPSLAGGTMLDIGIYNVFMATSVLGKPNAVKAFMTPSSTGVDEQCAVTLLYNNGAIAQLFSTFTSNLATEANINGTKGRIKLTHRFYSPDAIIEYYPGQPDSKQIIPVERGGGHGYQYEARHVCNCLQKGLTESPIMTYDDTLQQMKVLDEIRQQAGIKYKEDEDMNG